MLWHFKFSSRISKKRCFNERIQTNSPTPMPSLTSTVQCCSQHALQKECWQGSASNESLLTTCRHTPQCRDWGAWRSNTPSNTAHSRANHSKCAWFIWDSENFKTNKMLQCKVYSAERLFLHIQGTCDCEPLPLAEIHNLITLLIQDFNCYLHQGGYVTAGHYLSICEKKIKWNV